MTSNSTPNAAPKTPPDIFDMERLAKTTAPSMEAASSAQNAQKVQPGQAALASMMQKAKPMHFGLAAATAALIWIGWPYVFTSDVTTSQPTSRLMLPATADTLAPNTLPALAPGASAALQQAAAPAPDTQLAQVSNPPALPPFVQPMPSAPPVKPAKPRHKAHRVPTAASSLHMVKANIGPASSKFSLNTVYSGQAWIADSERTYVVQVGDTVKGISILSIDARERRVVTSQGVIR